MGEPMTKYRTITVEVCNLEQYDGDWPTSDCPSTLMGAIAWFNNKLAEIPEEYRATARCEIASTGGWEGCHYGHIEINYQRLETKEEAACRQAKQKAHEASIRDHEISQLRKLRAKYGE